jgi:iron complex transport system permease protein
MLFGVSFGSVKLGMGEVLKAIFAKILPFAGIEADELTSTIVWRLRMRWVCMAIITGAGLGISGAVMQGVLRNPLVSPFTMGVSSGATLGASLAIIMGFTLIENGRYMIIFNAFIFSIITSVIIIIIGRLRGVTPESFILVGIALMYLFSAVTSLLQYFAEEGELMALVHWILGSIERPSWGDVGLVSILVALCLPLLIKFSWDLNVMAFEGDEIALSLGINPGRIRVISMILVSLVTATITSFTGIIGFVGLVAPHVVRLIIGGDHRYLIPSSGLVGAIMVVAADTFARIIMPPTVLPVGVVMGFVGGMFFLFMLITRRRRYWR